MIKLTVADTNWREKVQTLETRLEQVRTKLIEAEATLAEQMARINAFEFKLRAAIEPLMRRLSAIEAEIKQILEARYGKIEDRESLEASEYWHETEAAARGAYRYMGHNVAETAPQKLSVDQTAELKKLYRQLARRFHPDMATDKADRTYRTQLMMAINAAYAAGDLEKLQELALEPDLAGLADQAQTDRQRAEALLRELTRHQHRLDEIQQELANLENHRSAHLLRQAIIAEAEGRDFLGEIAAELRDKITEKRMELELLQSEEWDEEQTTLQDEEFDEGLLTLGEWMAGRQRPMDYHDDYWGDILDDF